MKRHSRQPWLGVALTVLVVLCAGLGAVVSPASAAPVDLVNPSLETVNGGVPNCFGHSGWGDNTDTWATTTPGHTGAVAQSVTITGYASGDRKLLMSESAACAPAVTPGAAYTAGVWYRSTTSAISFTMFRHSVAGWTYWTDLSAPAAATDWTLAQVTTPVVPDGTDQVSFGISLHGNGTLITDDYSLAVAGASTPPPGSELQSNPGLESGGATPTGWFLTGWGDGTVTSGVVAGAHSGTRAYSLTLSGRTQGDFKLLPTEAASPAVQPGVIYQLSAWYRSTSAANNVTIFAHTASGWGYWTDLATLPAAAGWTQTVLRTPPVAAGVDAIAWGISLSGDGTLVTDDYSTTSVTTVTPPTGPAAEGQWTVLTQQMPIRAMHATVLKNGKVLLLAGSGNNTDSFAAGTFRASVWDPVSNTFNTLAVPKDMFCSGHVTLPDGRVLIQGGTKSYPTTAGGADYGGLKDSWIFDPDTETFSTVAQANEGHWYPTLTELGNGDIWMAGGLKEDTTGAVNTEMWKTSQNQWLPGNQVPQSWSFWGLYPHMFLMSDGRLFYSGGHVFGNGLPGTGASIYNWQAGTITDVPGLRSKDLRDQAASVLLPPAQDQRVLITGGGNINTQTPGISQTDLIDLKAASPAYTPGPDLPGLGKMYVNATILPDRTVLMTNGGRLNRDNSSNVLTAAIFDPASNGWTSVAADPIGRNYHSTAVLLPDGRTAVLGSNPGDGSYELRISVYSPGYLFRGARPEITGTPATATYGQSFSFPVTTPSGKPIRWAQFMRPMSVTHQMDSNMRLVDLPVVVQQGTAMVTVPANANLLPPGPYMLTVTDTDGVPSQAAWVTVR